MAENTQAQDQKPKDITKAAGMTAIVNWNPESATEAWNLARYYAESGLLPKEIKSVADIFVTIAAGRDFGWSPMQSMRGIYVVKGKPSLSADAMVAIAKQSGLCEYFRLIESDAQKATYETKRKGDPSPVRLTFTVEEAQAAGLLVSDKDATWNKYRPRMIRNRCKGGLCKEVYEDLLFGVYEESEAREITLNDAPSAAPIRTAPPPAISNDPLATAETTPSTSVAASQQTVTAEATKTEAQPQTKEPAAKPNMELFDQLFARIDEAVTVEGLKGLVPELQKLPKEEQRALKSDFDKKMKQLEEAKK